MFSLGINNRNLFKLKSALLIYENREKNIRGQIQETKKEENVRAPWPKARSCTGGTKKEDATNNGRA